jgi:hypothetical protein
MVTTLLIARTSHTLRKQVPQTISVGRTPHQTTTLLLTLFLIPPLQLFTTVGPVAQVEQAE